MNENCTKNRACGGLERSTMKLLSFRDWENIKKMSLNEANRWVLSLYGSAYSDGQQAFAGGEMWAVPEDMLFNAIVSVKGVGTVRAGQIVDAIFHAASVYEQMWEGAEGEKANSEFG